ncbi:MAG: hypothetical protein JWR22_3217 [Herminiimonas sp.]|nr:hypothetical protein [Herminiimonas sp.]
MTIPPNDNPTGLFDDRIVARRRAAERVGPIGSWEFRVSDEKLTWSDATYRIFGVSPKTFAVSIEAFLSSVHPADRSLISASRNHAIANQAPLDFEHRIVRPTGEVRHVHESAEFHRNVDGSTVLIGAVRDITDRKNAEEEAGLLAARLADTLENITDAFFTLDSEWRFSYVNAQAERLLRRPRGELLGNLIQVEVPQAIGGPYYDQCRRARDENRPVFFEEYSAPLGIWFEVRVFPSNDGLAIYFRDVTERRLALDAIRESEERFKIVAKATSDAVWDWNVQTGSVWWSEGTRALFGLRSEDLGDGLMSWLDRVHPSDKETVHRRLMLAVAGDGEEWSEQYRFECKDGSYSYVLDHGYVIRDVDGRATRMVGSVTDVTAEKSAQAELARLNRALTLRGACDDLINSGLDEFDLLNKVCGQALTNGRYRAAWIGYAKQDSERSIDIVAMAGDGDDREYIKGLSLSWSAERPEGMGPAGMVVRSGRPQALEDIVLLPHFALWARAAQARGYRGVINLPLRHLDRTFGLLTLYADGPLVAVSHELKLLQEMADNLSFAIENIQARKEKQTLQSAVLKVAESVSVGSGVAFFEQLARNMGEAIGAQGSFVAKYLPDQLIRAKTVAAIINGEVAENFEYTLSGTPCEKLLDSLECFVPARVGEIFPKAHQLQALAAQAYVGRRLDDSSGRPIGMLFAVFREPTAQSALVSSAMRVFGSRAAAELERQESDAKMREKAALLDKAKDAIVVKGMDDVIRFWNKGAERLYGISAEEAVGRPIEKVLFKDPSQLRMAMQLLLERGAWSGATLERHKNGAELVIENQWTLVCDEDGAPQSVFAIKTDITQRKAAEDAIHSLAFYDPLTGLANRRLLVERLTASLAARAGSERNGAVLYVDLDNFKTLNDTLGHDQGDELLRQAAARIKSCVPEGETVARLGGDEFVVVLDKLEETPAAAAAQATQVGAKILAVFNAPFYIDSSECHSTPSIGIALFGERQSASELLKRADLAMYQAKAAGRNTARFFDPAMQAAATAKVELEADLRQGLRLGEFALHYQPQMDSEGRVTGAEALARWQNPRRGMVSPVEFIPLAEETGLIVALGESVLRTACAQLTKWCEIPRLAELTVAVNVSARQFRHPGFAEKLLAILADTGADPRRLKLELTESVLLENVEETIQKMNLLKTRGVCFSLDDFGTGYSSLMYLKRLPLDQLKIDQSFVRDVLVDSNDAAIARAIITLGQSLGLAVIAEGVETEEQRAFLSLHGCHAYQGFLFSPALPASAFEAFVEARVGAWRTSFSCR